MFSTIAAFAGLLIFVLPGFIASRIASRDRAAPAALRDLELVLRGLAYSLVIHAFFALVGWTPRLVREVDDGDAWANHVGELALFALAVIVAAVVLGEGLRWLFDLLERQTKPWARAAYHALGEQDARDGFDYIFLRRKKEAEQFIVQVYTADDEQFAGVYGTGSFFGLSPRPHDLYLEEMWEFAGNEIRRPEERPLGGGWFAPDAIRRVEFRELPDEEAKAGETRRFGIQGIREALRETRETRARELADAAASQTGEEDVPSRTGLQQAVSEANAEGARARSFDEVRSWRETLVHLGGRILRALAVEEAEEPHSFVPEVRRRAADFKHTTDEWDLWLMTLAWYADHLQESRYPEIDLLEMGALLTEALVRIDDVDWSDEEPDSERGA